ncbi:MAG TPA: SpvB/TcaC N-terminal domain-containing protein, partial [Terriglobales bacterium]|nr:SpvB/TcaC N-terminal domain-containing protein [Terriglobales bacterium]
MDVEASGSEGEIWVHPAQLTIDSPSFDRKSEATFWVGKQEATDSTTIDLVPADGGWVQSDTASVYFPADALDGSAMATITELPTQASGPELQFTVNLLDAQSLETNDGTVEDTQQIDPGDELVEQKLAEPAFLEVNFDSIVDLSEIPAGMEPYIATYDEEYDVWVKAPIVETNYIDNTVTVETEHFSTWGAGLGSSLPQNGAGALLFDQPYTSLFTGGAMYSVPVWTPPGRAGMAPSITLSYSSKTIDGVLGDVQAPWVGVGWNIDAVEIVRTITTSDTGYGYVNNFALTFNGEQHNLVQDSAHPSRYYTERASFLYIERHAPAFGNDGGVLNTTKEWWEIVATDGTRYRLGWNLDSEQLTLMYGYKCTTGNPCTTPDTPYASSGYAGIATNLVASRWRVDRIIDTHGNYMDYAYDEEQPSLASGIPQFDRESYIEFIDFTGHTSGGLNGSPDLDPAYQMHFILGNRTDIGDTSPLDFGIWDQWDSSYLDKIEACYGACSGGTL